MQWFERIRAAWCTDGDMLSMGQTRACEAIKANCGILCKAWLWMVVSGLGTLYMIAGDLMYVNKVIVHLFLMPPY